MTSVGDFSPILLKLSEVVPYFVSFYNDQTELSWLRSIWAYSVTIPVTYIN